MALKPYYWTVETEKVVVSVMVETDDLGEPSEQLAVESAKLAVAQLYARQRQDLAAQREP